MHPIRPAATQSRRWARSITALVAILALGAILVPTALARGSKTVAGEAKAPSLQKSVLTNTKGLTLYSLSIEKNGKFACTSGCLYTWAPLLVPAGTTPKGPVKLGTIKRPEGKTQVTFKGLPLYTFDGDSAKGQANGQGGDDVGPGTPSPHSSRKRPGEATDSGRAVVSVRGCSFRKRSISGVGVGGPDEGRPARAMCRTHGGSPNGSPRAWLRRPSARRWGRGLGSRRRAERHGARPSLPGRHGRRRSGAPRDPLR